MNAQNAAYLRVLRAVRRAQETEQRRALFNAETDAEIT